ncbi:hypothetical protein V1477_004207 [Vespula maculifrons]|uniref:Uncharacterized protein n=3 Tax=Vespula TaxID=7451 RepID=A0A834JEY9_VESGE|nr:hypothetical protein HZH68_012836 [Vespula germanica]
MAIRTGWHRLSNKLTSSHEYLTEANQVKLLCHSRDTSPVIRSWLKRHPERFTNEKDSVGSASPFFSVDERARKDLRSPCSRMHL